MLPNDMIDINDIHTFNVSLKISIVKAKEGQH